MLQYNCVESKSFGGWSGGDESSGGTDWRRYRPCKASKSAESATNKVFDLTFPLGMRDNRQRSEPFGPIFPEYNAADQQIPP